MHQPVDSDRFILLSDLLVQLTGLLYIFEKKKKKNAKFI